VSLGGITIRNLVGKVQDKPNSTGEGVYIVIVLGCLKEQRRIKKLIMAKCTFLVPYLFKKLNL
jgi:hypothetical protein